MKKIVYLLSFMFVGLTYAQTTNQTTNQTQRDNNRTAQGEMMNRGNERPAFYDIQESSDYSYNNQNYRFTPNDERGLDITTNENGVEREVGNLRRTTEDGYYIMTSNDDPNNVSFGRFDDQGNFRSYRYDRTTDSVLEEDYNISSPRNIRGNGQGTMNQGNQRNNTQGTMNQGNQRTNTQGTMNQGNQRTNTQGTTQGNNRRTTTGNNQGTTTGNNNPRGGNNL